MAMDSGGCGEQKPKALVCRAIRTQRKRYLSARVQAWGLVPELHRKPLKAPAEQVEQHEYRV
ncbi:hypothetical protein BK634_25835 [Pseudomonas chlororaphis]|nr:hypothetical protein BK634_25835 [Pseudomonas chlororaphis]